MFNLLFTFFKSLASFLAFSSAYLRAVTWEPPGALEERAATLLPGLLLGRVDGKSPVEYFDEAGQARVREAARKLLVKGERTLLLTTKNSNSESFCHTPLTPRANSCHRGGPQG